MGSPADICKCSGAKLFVGSQKKDTAKWLPRSTSVLEKPCGRLVRECITRKTERYGHVASERGGSGRFGHDECFCDRLPFDRSLTRPSGASQKRFCVHRIVFILLCLLPTVAIVDAQEVETYRTVRPSGTIPSDFTVPSSDKFSRAKQNLELEGDEQKTRQAKQDFLLESNFLIDQVLGSGRVLFNDAFSSYLNEILDTILVHDPQLRKQIRVYAVRSSVVNSFTTDDGIILVNLGLLAQLETEAQLAFILCHEVVHYTNKHVLNAYVQNELLADGSSLLKRNSFDEKMLAKSRYSKELEKEADRLGYQRFAQTPYGIRSLTNVFEVMRYAHLPFDDIEFDRTFFDQHYYRINDSYFLGKVRPPESNEADDPQHETHPSPTERMQLLGQYLATDATGDKPDFVVSEKRFKELRAAARFELSDLYLKADRPVMCIYNSYLLLKQFPNNQYLRTQIAAALYSLSKFKSGGNYGKVHPGFSQIQGESQQLYHLLYRLKPDELCILALGYTYRLKQELHADADVNRMAEDLLEDLMRLYYVPGMFEREPPKIEEQQADSLEFDSKYDRLRHKSKELPRISMVTYALVDLFSDPEFEQRFNDLERKEWGNGKNGISRGEAQQQQTETFRSLKNHGFAVGAEKVVVVSPTYAKLDLRKKQQHRFLHSESAKAKLLHQITRSANLLALDVEIIDRTRLDSTQVETFNDITFLNEWVDARFNQIDVGMVNMPQQEIDSLIAKYGTEYFLWTGVINYRENKPLMYFYLLYALIPPAIPFAIYYLARPNFDTYYYSIAFNLRTGEPALINYNNYHRRDSRDMINSSVYDTLWQLKRKPKEKG
ncbi:MAG: hypothetical protein EP314_01350 [Bacteroidetes bacterium]|nr:MAG: hypothetical protein EP314_01350 [Bacteroidota bacterium]